jgi:branched-chain amino acid aminotransferase
MAHELAYVNGKLVPVAEAVVPVHDRSFLYGDGAFDTAVVRRGRVFRLDTHLDRLLRSLVVLRIPPPLSKPELRDAALDLMRRNAMVDGFLRIVVSRGTCPYVSLDPRAVAGGPTLVMLTRSAEPPGEIAAMPMFAAGGRAASGGDHARGVRAVTAAIRKTPTASFESRVKSNNYLNGILARWEAIDAGADEAILLDDRGRVTEGSGDNVFAVCGGRLVTPPALNILEGITRDTILTVAPRVPITAEVRDLTPYDLYTAGEVFLTSTVVGVMPILELDGRPIGSAAPGPVARRLQALYDDVLIAEGTPIDGAGDW